MLVTCYWRRDLFFLFLNYSTIDNIISIFQIENWNYNVMKMSPTLIFVKTEFSSSLNEWSLVAFSYSKVFPISFSSVSSIKFRRTRSNTACSTESYMAVQVPHWAVSTCECGAWSRATFISVGISTEVIWVLFRFSLEVKIAWILVPTFVTLLVLCDKLEFSVLCFMEFIIPALNIDSKMLFVCACRVHFW